MANLTTKLKLKLPLAAESYNIEDFNSNFTAIDDYAVAQDAINTATDSRIKGQSLKESIAISDNTDLNALKSPGIYTCATDAICATISNFPIGASRLAFTMSVMQTSATSVIQALSTNANVLYLRAVHNSSVSSWVKLADHMDLASKVDKIDGKGLSTQDYTTSEKEKLKDIADRANNYVHPQSHSATMIVEVADKRFMTDSERSKLSGVAAGANNYIHPGVHPAIMIETDASRRFISDAERSSWNSKAAGNHNHDTAYASHGDITDVKKQTRIVQNKALYTTDWTLVSGLYRATIVDAKVTVDSIVSANIQLSYLDIVTSAGMKPVTVSYSGGFYMYCAKKPSGSIVLDYVAIREVA